MCNRMPEKYIALATRMKNMSPTITDYPNIELVVDNQIMLEQLTDIRGNIANTFKKHLGNKSITFTLRLAEQHEKARILTRREQFEEILKDNPALEKLKNALSLELA